MGVIKPTIIGAAVAVAALMSAESRADAIPAATPYYTTANSPTSHVVSGGAYSGVADVILSRSDGTFRCTGGLLSGGQYLLTAAHCVTGTGSASLVTGGTATFSMPGGTGAVGLGEVHVNPGWNGSVLNGNDLAIIKLTSAAPAGAEQYDIYRDSDEAGQVATRVGFGRSGTGLTGSTLASGTQREGLNRYDTTGTAFGFLNNRSSQLVYDFDDGTAAHDALGFYLGASYADLGLGDEEVMAAPGDSGGPSFIDGMIAGITSYGMRLSKYVADQYTSSDIDAVINSSFGEIGADTRVSAFATWIDSIVGPPPPPTTNTSSYVPPVDSFQVASIPEPALMTLFGLGALGAFAARRRKQA